MNDVDDALVALCLEDEAESAPLRPRPAAGPAPLSFAQQRLWLLQRLEPTSTAYNLTRAFLLRGRLDIEALECAFNALVERHEILRTALVATAGEPEQQVLAALPLAITVDAVAEDSAAVAELVAARLEAEARRPFDLARPPLLRVTLLRFSDDCHGLILAMHHVVSDAWSNPVLVRDLATAYRAARAGVAPSWSPLPVQYADYACWQRAQVQGDGLRAALRYWRDYLGQRLPALALPTDRPRPARQSDRGRRWRFELPAELAAEAQAFCRRERFTPFVLLLAAWQILLARYSGQAEFAIGVPHAGRSRSELDQLIGFFVNTLVYRVRLEPALTGLALCRRLRQESLVALEHAELPFEFLLEQLEVERDPSRSPVFQVLFNLSMGAPVRLQLADVDVEPVRTSEDSAKFDLTLDVAVEPEAVRCELEYNIDLFQPETVARMADAYRELVTGLVRQPECPVGRLPLLPAHARRQLLQDWNRTDQALSAEADLVARFERQAAMAPTRWAVYCGSEVLSYGELNARANRLARWLRATGVQRDELVGVCLPREVDLLVVLLAIQKAGAGYLPIDPAQPAARNADILAQARPRLVLSRAGLMPENGSGARVVMLGALSAALATEDASNLGLPVHPRQLAYCLYTSGSTGRPKGVQIEREAFANFLLAMQAWLPLGPDDRLLAVTTLGFDIAGLELFLPLVQGASVVLATQEQALQPRALLQLLSEQAITAMQATPATWQMLVEYDSPAWSGLRVLCGGEALGAELATLLLARGVRLTNVYGPTETTVWSSAEAVTQVAGAVMPIGRPLANNRFYILDEALEPQPIGVEGDLYIGGAGLARGYAERPGLTAAAFVPNPFVDDMAAGAGAGSRLYRTGDRARYRADGRIEFLGRRDFQVKLRGFRIELGEIEAALAAQPAVRQVVVTLRVAPGGQAVLVAYVRTDAVLTLADVLPALRAQLPAYMLPSALVTLPAFPLNANGKVDRPALPEPAWGGVTTASTPPVTDTEQRLAALWGEVLGVRAITREDDLFALGAQSLQVVRIQARVRALFGCELPLAELFVQPRLTEMAALIDRAGATGDAALAEIDALLAAYE